MTSIIKPNVHGVGPLNADIMIIGEAPSNLDIQRRQPFADMSGQELTRMLHEAGIVRTECYITLLCKEKIFRNDITKLVYGKKTKIPADFLPYQDKHVSPILLRQLEILKEEIENVKPKLIIVLGDIALWSIYGEDSIFKWRGSELNLPDNFCPEIVVPGVSYKQKVNIKLIPAYAPAIINKRWMWRSPTIVDFKRAKREATSRVYSYDPIDFIIQPSFDLALSTLNMLLAHCQNAVTRPHIVSPPQKRIMGYAPYLVPDGPNDPDNGTLERTRRFPMAVDIETINRVTACVGIAWSSTEAIVIPFMTRTNMEGYWTLEEEVIISQKIEELLTHPGAGVIGQNYHYDSFILAWERGFVSHVLDDTMTMQHCLYPGIQKSLDFLSSMYCEHHVYWKDELDDYKSYPDDDHVFWNYNAKDCIKTFEVWKVLDKLIDKGQMRENYTFQMQLFDPLLAMMLQGININLKHRNDLRIRLMNEIAEVEKKLIFYLGHPINPNSPKQLQILFYKDFGIKPIFNKKTHTMTCDDAALKKIAAKEPLLSVITDLISIYRTLNIFLSTFVNASTESDNKIRCTFKLNGTETFRFASSKNPLGNGMNLQTVSSGDEAGEGGYVFPNIRRMFIPKLGDVIMDWDLEKADAQVVAWEAEDEGLKQIFREGMNLHAENAKDIFGKHTKHTYAMAKRGVHAVNYGISERSLAVSLGITVHEASRFKRMWFGAHPLIPEWQERVRHDLMTTRSVRNAFGYRRIYFDRIDGILGEALAWVPQSTVAIVVNKGLYNLYKNLSKQVDLLIQVHDSLVLQTPRHSYKTTIPLIEKEMNIIVPYPDPLLIKVNCKVGKKNWGELD